MSVQDAGINGPVAKFTPLASDLEVQMKECKYNEELFISNLPFDVLSSIFILCQRTVYSLEDQFTFPLVVSHVCKQWRATALSTPLLWNTILLSWRACSLSQLEAHLTRSGTCFLDIYIASNFPEPCVLPRVIGLLIPHCRRWRKFYLDGDSRISRLLPEYLREVSLSLLEYFYLVNEVAAEFVAEDPGIRGTIHLHDAPSLHFVHLSGVLSIDFQPHLTDLTTLELGSGYAFSIKRTDLVHILRELRSLLRLSLRISWWEPDDPPTVAIPVTLLHLCALRIRGYYHRDYFSWLLLPCLETLFLEILLDFDLPSFPLVKSVTIQRCGAIGSHELTKVATSCPSLTHLDVDWLDDIDCQLWLMSLEDIPWASLQKITVRNMQYHTPSTLSTIVSAHIAWGYPLKEMSLGEDSRCRLGRDWFEERVKLTFSDTDSFKFEGWSTITGFGPCDRDDDS